jgi:transcriptional regulator with XRE-family HTH domain
MTGYHTRWARPEESVDDPERIAIREALAFGKALYDIRTSLGLSVAELALRAALTDDDIERIEEGGTEPTIPLLPPCCAASPLPSTPTSASPPDTTSAPSGSKPTQPEPRLSNAPRYLTA